jgi:hypothetical protein
MKKVFLATYVFLSIIISSSVFAQSSKLSLGIVGGAGISNAIHLEPGFGYTSMIDLQYNLSKIFSVNVGFGYEKKSANDDILVADTSGQPLYDLTISQDFEFLTMPVLVRANFGSKINYFVNVGPSFNYLLK